MLERNVHEIFDFAPLWVSVSTFLFRWSPIEVTPSTNHSISTDKSKSVNMGLDSMWRCTELVELAQIRRWPGIL